MQDKVYKVAEGIRAPSSHDHLDFWFDKDFYKKNDRLKLSEKERLRREAIKQEKDKFKNLK